MILGRNPVYVMAAIRAGLSFLVIAGLLALTAEEMSSLFLFLETLLVLAVNHELTPNQDVRRLEAAAQGAIDAKSAEIDALKQAASSVREPPS